MAITRISVVIPTIGRPILIQTVRSILSCEGGDALDVMIVGTIADPDVRDAVLEIVKENGNVRHFDVSWPNGDSSRKKNYGVEQSQYDIVAFFDDDVTVAPDWPSHISHAFEDPRVGLVSGPSLVPDNINLAGRMAGLVLASLAAGYVADRYRVGNSAPREIGWNRIIGCNAAYRKDVFERIGGFPVEFYPGEEMIAAWRAQKLGCRLMFVPNAWVYHYPRQSVTRFWRQIWSYGATRIRLYRAGVDWELSALVPGLWTLSLFALGVGSLFSQVSLTLLLLELSAYALFMLLIGVLTVHETKRFSDIGIILMVPVMHLAYGLGSWQELILPDKDFGDS